MAVPKYSAQDFVNDLRHDTYPFVDPKKLNLSGKHILITGASKGIGRALAVAYAQAGAAGIAIGARSDLASLEKEINQAASAAGWQAPKVIRISLDVTDLASAEAAAKTTESAFGKLDILVNNAGYLATWAKMAEGDPAEWWKTWEVNIKGVYYVKRAFIPLLLKGSDKTIVNLSSIGAHFVRAGASDYQPSKLVVCRLAEFASQDYAEEGLLAYSVHPGGIPTELALNMPSSNHALLNDTVELASDTIVWLTSAKRDWLAGRYLSCNWDMEQFLQRKEDVVKGDLLKFRLAV